MISSDNSAVPKLRSAGVIWLAASPADEASKGLNIRLFASRRREKKIPRNDDDRPTTVRLEVSGIDNVKLSITPGTNPVVRCPKIWCWSSCTPRASSVIVTRGHRRSGRARAAKGKTRFFVFPSRSKPTDLRTALSNLNDEKTRARERESDIRREEKRVSERRFASARENKKRVSCSVSRRHQALVGFTTPPTNYHRRMVN